MSVIPSWVSILAALLTPTIAVFGLALGFVSHRLALRRRRDELFDRRYEFYQRFRTIWLNTGTGTPSGQCPWLDVEQLIEIADEAQFLFGANISRHIVSLADPPFSGQHKGHPGWPDEEFVAPFRKYLSIEGRLESETIQGTNTMKNIVYVTLGWCLVAAAWCFLVLHIAPSLDRTVRDQRRRQEAYEFRTGSHIRVPGRRPDAPARLVMDEHIIALDSLDRPVERPTWPRWIVSIVGRPASFATEFPFWTTAGGIGLFAWSCLFSKKLAEGWRAKKHSTKPKQVVAT